jgi:XRN 5'-3' exonuclease N-terminus
MVKFSVGGPKRRLLVHRLTNACSIVLLVLLLILDGPSSSSIPTTAVHAFVPPVGLSQRQQQRRRQSIIFPDGEAAVPTADRRRWSVESTISSSTSTTSLCGIPKMFRWLTDQYPDIVHRQLDQDGLDVNLVVDNLYLDMNGIIHPCTHGDEQQHVILDETAMFKKIFLYVDRCVCVWAHYSFFFDVAFLLIIFLIFGVSLFFFSLHLGVITKKVFTSWSDRKPCCIWPSTASRHGRK